MKRQFFYCCVRVHFAGTCSQRRCLAMNVCTGSAIPASGRHVTISTFTVAAWGKLRPLEPDMNNVKVYFFFGTYLSRKSSALCSGKYDSHKIEKHLKLLLNVHNNSRSYLFYVLLRVLSEELLPPSVSESREHFPLAQSKLQEYTFR
jgi:hypothetical protein